MEIPNEAQYIWICFQYCSKSSVVNETGRFNTNCAYIGAKPVVAISLAISCTDSQADSCKPSVGIRDSGSLVMAMASPLGRLTIDTSTPNCGPTTTSLRGLPQYGKMRDLKKLF